MKHTILTKVYNETHPEPFFFLEKKQYRYCGNIVALVNTTNRFYMAIENFMIRIIIVVQTQYQ
jgi:hypothetical protein